MFLLLPLLLGMVAFVALVAMIFLPLMNQGH